MLGGSVGGVALLVLSLSAVARNGVRPIPLILGSIGAVLLMIAMFDLPVASRFASEGIERRMVLRRHRISWERVTRLARTRSGFMQRARNRASVGGSRAPSQGGSSGGLIAEVGRRRYLLVDQTESREEFAELQRWLRSWAPELVDESLAPWDGAHPTFLYRRKRWAPEQPSDR